MYPLHIACKELHTVHKFNYVHVCKPGMSLYITCRYICFHAPASAMLSLLMRFGAAEHILQVGPDDCTLITCWPGCNINIVIRKGRHFGT